MSDSSEPSHAMFMILTAMLTVSGTEEERCMYFSTSFSATKLDLNESVEELDFGRR